MERKTRLIQYLITCSVSLASVNSGALTGWLTPVIHKFKTNQTDLHISDTEIAWVVALGSPGFMIGSFISRYTSDYFGRRITLLGSALPAILGTLIIVSFPAHVWPLYMTKILWGTSVGLNGMVANMYISEIADSDIRGSLSVATRFMFNFGTLLTMSTGLYFSYNTINYMLLLLPVMYFCACFWIPESPYFLLKEGKLQEAKKALVRLKGHKDAEEAIIRLQGDVKKEMQRSSSAKELFTGKQYRKALIVAIGLKLGQMFTGSLTITQYLGVVMIESKSTLSLTTAFIVFAALRFIASLCSSVIADKVGRRPLLIYTFLGTAVSLGVVGLYFFMLEVIQPNEGDYIKYAHVAFICLVLSNVISTLGFQSIVNIIPAEIFPLNVKAVACTSYSMFGGLLGFLSARGYQAMKDVAGLTGVFWFYGSVGFFAGVFVYFYMPETRGKALRDIQIELQGAYYDQDVDEKLNQIAVDNPEAGEEMKMLKESPELLTKDDDLEKVNGVKIEPN